LDTQDTTISAEASPSILSKAFIGKFGLRAGWRFALFNFLFFIVAFALLFLRRALMPGGFKGNSFTAPVVILQEVIFLIAISVALAVMLRIEKKPFALNFLPLQRPAGWHLGAGIISGLSAITLLILGMWSAHAISFDSLTLHGMQALKFPSLWAIAFLIVEKCDDPLHR